MKLEKEDIEGEADTTQLGPGDRYLFDLKPNHGTSQGADDSVEVPQRVLAVCPYTHTFRAPVKGRWVGLPLLSVFVKEFAYVTEGSLHATAAIGSPGASLDPRVTIPAYVRELAEGVLRVQGREDECLAAGRAYSGELRHVLQSGPLPMEMKKDAVSSSNGSTKDVEAADERGDLCCNMFRGGETVATEELKGGVNVDLLSLLNTLPPRIVLRQRDVILHDVLRQEAPMPFGEPLQILRYDHLPRGVPQRRLLVVMKPYGIPVHPSGRSRKNSVTSILEDVFGGVDAHRYYAVPYESIGQERDQMPGVRWISVLHKKYGFELIRVWVGEGYVSLPSWEALQSYLSREDGSAPKDKGLKPYVVHRLDSATSGVLLFALDSASARITAELLSRKEDLVVDEHPHSNGKTKTPSDVGSGCSKHYLAKVHGCFDARKLASGEHNCCLAAFPPALQSSTSYCDDSPWLRIDRPIGCYSYHESLYWCPDAAVTQSWFDEQDRDQKINVSCTAQRIASSNKQVPGRKRAKYSSTEEMKLKHNAMRKLTVGARGAGENDKSHQDTDENNSSDCDVEAQQRLRQTLKRAATLVRRVSYDANRNESVVECVLITGRTHQVRVHLASIRHPIHGDHKYIHHSMKKNPQEREGNSACPEGCSLLHTSSPSSNEAEKNYPQRILLHAWRYTLRYEQGGPPDIIQAPLPEWLQGIGPVGWPHGNGTCECTREQRDT